MEDSIHQLNVNGKKLSANEVDAKLCSDELADKIFSHSYCMGQIFNANETGLNYKMLPSKTLAGKLIEKLLEQRNARNRCSCIRIISITLISFWKIGETLYFGKLQPSISPILYKNQRSAWMDVQLFQD